MSPLPPFFSSHLKLTFFRMFSDRVASMFSVIELFFGIGEEAKDTMEKSTWGLGEEL